MADFGFAEVRQTPRVYCGFGKGRDLGDETFKERLLEKLGLVVQDRQRASYSGEAMQGHDEQVAERLIQAGLKVLGLGEADLAGLRRADPRKCALAWLAHTRTTAAHKWLAERLHMGYPSNMTVYIDAVRRSQNPAAVAAGRRLARAIPK